MAKTDKFQYGSIDFQGKKVPLTKEGLPNLVNLPKDAREIVSQFKDKKKKAKQEILKKDLEDILKSLK
jgi:hypothetical protein